MKKTFKYSAMVAVATILLISCLRNKEQETSVKNNSNLVVLQWNEVAYHAFGGANYQHSLMASRINAMMNLAIHDAVNAVEPVYEFYIFKGNDEAADPVAAAAAAAYTVLLNELPGKKEYLDSALQES